MFYVFSSTGEQSSWEQYSVGFSSLEKAKYFKSQCDEPEFLGEYETCIREKL